MENFIFYAVKIDSIPFKRNNSLKKIYDNDDEIKHLHEFRKIKEHLHKTNNWPGK